MAPKLESQTAIRWKKLLQVVVAVALVLFLLRSVPLNEIKEAFQQTNLLLFAVGTLLFFPTFWLQAVRWKLLFPQRDGEPLSTSLFFRLICIGQFASLFLPSSVGGDAVRAYLLGKEQGGVGAAGSSVLLGRMIGVVALLLFLWIGWAIAPEHLAPFPPLFFLLIALTAASVVALFLFFKLPIRFFDRWRHKRGVGGALQHLKAIRSLGTGPLLRVVALSIAIQFSSNLLTWVLYRASGMPFPWEGLFSLIPLLMLLNLIPISFFNIGVREGAMIFLFTPLTGITPALCIAASTLGYAAVLAPAFVGFLFFIKRPQR